MIAYRLPSYGIFNTAIETSYFFGIPRSISFSGLAMDVDGLAIQRVAKDNNRDTSLNFMLAIGARASAMEHLVPEQFFSTEGNPAQSISAVKALAIASAEGQKVWTIDQNNLTQALSAISLDPEIETEIANAVHAGKVATTHEKAVQFAGGTTAGYLLIDPVTGSGAYLIGSGEGGGE